jgi:FkbH-like protein
MPDRRYAGPFGYGVDIRFGRWAKLETWFHGVHASPSWARRIDACSRFASLGAKQAAPALFFLPHIRRATWFVEHARNRLLSICGSRPKGEPSHFVLECYNLEESPVQLVMQCADASGVFFRRAITLSPGLNREQWEYDDLSLRGRTKARIAVFPDGDREARVLFTWLDFVKMTASRPELPPVSDEKAADRLAPQVKCIAWDLDNTLWDGVLVEDGPEKVRLRSRVMDVIKALDERGIIHTIVSKNTHAQAWETLQRLGVHQYFVFPAINWGAKSENLIQVAKRINIGLDTVLMVDDSAFERAEVSAKLPMVRVCAETQVEELPDRPDLRSPVTEMSRARRSSYLAEMEREEFRTKAAGDDLAYLRQCLIRASIFTPTTLEEIERCLELVQRSNQLNLSARRYTAEEFSILLQNDACECFGVRCADRFGDYGIVGFISVNESGAPLIGDFVLSCRVAKRRVEHAIIKWLANRYASRGHQALKATLVRTDRNGVLAEVFHDLPFECAQADPKTIEFTLPVSRAAEVEDVVVVDPCA